MAGAIDHYLSIIEMLACEKIHRGKIGEEPIGKISLTGTCSHDFALISGP